MAVYPSGIKTWANKTDGADNILAAHINEAYAEIIAIETAVTANTTQIASLASGSPKAVYATLALLQSAFPSGNANIYLITADGNWYYWNGAWTAGGTYQTTGIAGASIEENLIARGAVTPERTSFVTTGKNKIDVNRRSVLGEWCNYTNGWIGSTEYTTTFYRTFPFVLTAGETYTRRYGSNGTVFFNKDMVFISGTQANTFTVPVNTAWVIANFEFYHLDEQIEIGTVPTTLENYCLKIEDLIINSSNYATDDTLYKLNLPPKIYAVVGKEVNVYFDNLMIDDAEKYSLDIVGSIGRQQNERWTNVPSVIETQPLTLYVYKDYGDGDENHQLAYATTSVITAAANSGSGLNKKYLQIGDSTAYGMINNGELVNNFLADVMDITLLGTQGTAPNLSEGYPGKGTDFIYSDPTSPFVFGGVFNFAQYMSTQGYADVDYIGIHLGINDLYGMNNDAQTNACITTAMTQFEGIISSIHVYNPNIKIGILLTIPPSRSQDSFGANDPTGRTRWLHKRNIMLWDKQLLAQFSSREGSNIFVVPFCSALDTVHNMAERLEPANSRTTVQVTRQFNALHPDLPGYAQMSDAIYYWIKNMV